MLTPKNWDGTSNLNDTVIFEVTDFSVPDYTPLYFQLNMFKNVSNKVSELVAISRFENKNIEF